MAQVRNTLGGTDRSESGERPLAARSVMASLLLGRRSARASGRDLVRWCALFGIAPGTARVALHRMTAAHELAREGGDYVLVGGLARRQREQVAALTPRVRAWRGSWRMAVVGAVDARPAPIRAETRAALRRARLAEWREGVWLRPDNLDVDESPACEWLDVRPAADPVALTGALFAPDGWRSDADRLLVRLDEATARLGADPEAALAPAFLAGAAALRHVRADPLLPNALLPQPWPGSDLRAAYMTYQRSFAAAAREWFALSR